MRLSPAAAATIAAYGGLIFWFSWVDVYDRHFFDRGVLILLYNLLRIVFAGAIAWLIYAPGAAILRVISGSERAASLGPTERYVLAFLTGAGFWHALLFGIGFAGGYTKPVAIGLSVATLILSGRHLGACLHKIGGSLRSVRQQAGSLWWLCCTAVFALYIAIKVVYPDGSNDYYTHYFYYYVDVIRNGSLAPNEAWYHFYYSKGWGLYFLAMLLSDPLAPQLVAATFVFTAASAVTLILTRLAPGTRLPWIGTALYLGLQIFTPNPLDFAGAAGWAELAKGHELSAALFMGLFWIATRLVEGVAEPRPWLAAAVAATVASVLVTAEMAAIIGTFFVLLAMYGAAAGRWRLGRGTLACATVAGVVLLFVLGINYAATGIPSDQLLLVFWPLVDLTKVARWGVLNEVLWQHFGLSGFAQQRTPVGWSAVRQLYRDLRLDLLWPIGAFGAAGALCAIIGRQNRRGRFTAPPRQAFIVCAVVFVASVAPFIAILGAGALQALSVYRFTSFAFGPTLCAVLLLCAAFPFASSKAAGASAGVILALVLSGETGKHGREMRAGIPMLSGSALSFATGRVSIAQAYQDTGWPGRYPWGGIYPAMETVWKVVGRGTPIYSFNLQSYCMLPDCRVLRWDDTRTIPEFETVLFGTDDEAVAAVKRAGIDFFFYSTQLADLPSGISTPIVLAPIFRPDAIADHFGIKWTDGTSYLLTWRDRSVRPLDDAFLAVYRRQVARSPIAASFPVVAWREVFEHFKASGLRPYRLPW